MKKVFAIAALFVAMTACNNRVNPFLTEWDTPYGIPPFDKIQPADYIPAVQAGIDQQNAEIDAITANPDAPTFENTIAPLELSGEILSKVVGVFYNITETDRTDALSAIEEEVISMMSEHSNNMSFNKALYNRVAAVYNGDQSGLTREQQVVLKKHFDAFEREGIGLPEEQQARLRQINADIAAKTQKIGNNILAESNDFLEKFGFSVAAYPDKMTSTEDRELRRQYNEAYTARGHRGNEFDNRQLLLEVLDLRAEKAKILGYPNAAAYILANKMAGDTQTVDNFLDGIEFGAWGGDVARSGAARSRLLVRPQGPVVFDTKDCFDPTTSRTINMDCIRLDDVTDLKATGGGTVALYPGATWTGEFRTLEVSDNTTLAFCTNNLADWESRSSYISGVKAMNLKLGANAKVKINMSFGDYVDASSTVEFGEGAKIVVADLPATLEEGMFYPVFFAPAGTDPDLSKIEYAEGEWPEGWYLAKRGSAVYLTDGKEPVHSDPDPNKKYAWSGGGADNLYSNIDNWLGNINTYGGAYIYFNGRKNTDIYIAAPVVVRRRRRAFSVRRKLRQVPMAR